MLAGSSAFQNEETKQVRSPRLRATLRAGYQAVSSPSTFSGNVMSLQSEQDALITPNFDRLLLSGTSNSLSPAIHTVATDGSTFFNRFNLGNSMVNSRFLAVGATVEFYYLDGDSTVKRRISPGGSFVGISWTSATTLYNSSGFILDLSLAGSTNIYLMESIGSCRLGEYGINRLRHDGSGWGVTTVLERVLASGLDYDTQIGVALQAHMINSIDLDATHSVIYQEIPDPKNVPIGITNPVNNQHNLKVFQIDKHLNIFDHRTLVEGKVPRSDQDGNNLESEKFTLGTLTKGLTYYWFSFLNRLNFRAERVSYTEYRDPVLMRSLDGVVWSNGILWPIVFSTTSTEPTLAIRGSDAVITSGITREFELIRGAWLDRVLLNNDSVDISEDIISYSNTNNERISLSLSNNVSQ